MRRRSWLSSLGTGGVVGVAGCTSLLSDPVESKRIAVSNHTAEAYQVRVRLYAGGDSVYDRTRSLPTRHGEHDATSGVFDGLPTDEHDYALSYKLLERTE